MSDSNSSDFHFVIKQLFENWIFWGFSKLFLDFLQKKIDFFEMRLYTVVKWSKIDVKWSKMEEVRQNDR